jgi:hypothetical protein
MVLAAIGLILVGRHSGDGEAAASSTQPSVPAQSYPPVDVSPVPRSTTADRLCPGFLAKLPEKVGGQGRRRVNAQKAYFLAWGAPPVIVQCGVPLPKGFTVGTQTIDIAPPKSTDSVRWFETGSSGVWTAVDRDVYIAVTVPDGGDTTGTLQTIGAVILKTLPARPIRPAR